MNVIRARNVNDAWDLAKNLLNQNHVTRNSRVGEVIECAEPVSTVYENPCERVLFNSLRNPNAIFHFMESMHMLAGRNDVAWLERFNSKISDFVGKDPHQHGAYGYRWRHSFDLDGGAEDGYADQLPKIVRMLKKDPNERRAVLCMWNPILDLERPDVADIPCNLIVTFKIREGRLCMIVFCRSNDIIFGCYGANVVHFSFLQEYMAAQIGIPVGTYTQISDSFHAYTARWKEFGGFDTTPSWNLYNPTGHRGSVTPYKLVDDPETFDEDLQVWMERDWKQGDDVPDFNNAFFPDVAEPLWLSWESYKMGNLDDALKLVSNCEATDWQAASKFWYKRVQEKRNQKGVTA